MSRDVKTLYKYTHVVGVDEAGRGPIAGPVAVCAVVAPVNLDILKEFPGVKDSKVMTEKARERVFKLVQTSEIRYAVHYGSVEDIETLGITAAVQHALNRCIADVAPRNSFIFLDGLLRAPGLYAQETVVKGDALVPIISLASVIAKVSRDHLMEDLSKEFPEYGFDRHKGYGTAAHYAAIKKFGPTPMHRLSFLSGVV